MFGNSKNFGSGNILACAQEMAPKASTCTLMQTRWITRIDCRVSIKTQLARVIKQITCAAALMDISGKFPKSRSVKNIYRYWMTHTSVWWMFSYLKKANYYYKKNKKKLPTKALHGRSKNEVLFFPPHVFASVTYKLVPQGREGGNVATNPGEASLSSINALCDITKGRIAQLTKEKDDLFPLSL